MIKRVFLKIKFAFERKSFIEEFLHVPVNGIPNVETICVKIDVTDEDILIAERVLRAFNMAITDESYEDTGNLWDLIKKTKYKDLYEILNLNDIKKFAEYMCNFHSKSLAYGISDYNSVNVKEFGKAASLESAVLVKDQMVALGEAIGAIRKTNDPIHIDSEILLSFVKDLLKVDITPPWIDGGLIKTKIGGVFFSSRDVYSIYTAKRLHDITGINGSVAEIGAGVGKVALYAHRFGISDYSIFDLPITNLAQGWYLLKSGLNVVLYGEDSIDGAVRVMPYFMFGQDRKYTVTMNQDGFPEMGGDIVAYYLEKIKANSQFLLSINHEEGKPYFAFGLDNLHIIVPQVVDSVGGFGRLSREVFPVRKSFFEEVYSCNPNKA